MQLKLASTALGFSLCGLYQRCLLLWQGYRYGLQIGHTVSSCSCGDRSCTALLKSINNCKKKCYGETWNSFWCSEALNYSHVQGHTAHAWFEVNLVPLPFFMDRVGHLEFSGISTRCPNQQLPTTSSTPAHFFQTQTCKRPIGDQSDG